MEEKEWKRPPRKGGFREKNSFKGRRMVKMKVKEIGKGGEGLGIY